MAGFWYGRVAVIGSTSMPGSPPGLVTIEGKPSDELAPGTKNSILKQAGLK